jgi:hypothetical protein
LPVCTYDHRSCNISALPLSSLLCCLFMPRSPFPLLLWQTPRRLARRSTTPLQFSIEASDFDDYEDIDDDEYFAQDDDNTITITSLVHHASDLSCVALNKSTMSMHSRMHPCTIRLQVALVSLCIHSHWLFFASRNLNTCGIECGGASHQRHETSLPAHPRPHLSDPVVSTAFT